MALLYLDSELLVTTLLEGGSPPLSTSESLELLGAEELGDQFHGCEEDKPIACVQLH